MTPEFEQPRSRVWYLNQGGSGTNLFNDNGNSGMDRDNFGNSCLLSTNKSFMGRKMRVGH